MDFVLVMSVNPGFGGQSFIPRSESKVAEVRALLDEAGNAGAVEVDGGIDLTTVGRVVKAGARMLVAGNAIFGTADPERATRELKAGPAGGLAPRLVPRRRGLLAERPPSPPFQVRVRYAETDQMGVVYHANYFVWFEVGRTDLLRSAGWTYRDMEADGCLCRSSKRTATTSSRPGTTTTWRFERRGRWCLPVRVASTYEVARPLTAKPW